jgi:hypothetical protein
MKWKTVSKFPKVSKTPKASKTPKSLAALKKAGGVPLPVKMDVYRRAGTSSYPSLNA